MKRAVFFVVHGAFLLFFTITSLYCLIVYVPFTFLQLIKPDLLISLHIFARAHTWLYWLSITGVAATISVDSGSRRLRTILLVVPGLCGIALLFHPLLTSIENNSAAYYWSLISLAPLLCFGIVYCAGHGGPKEQSDATLLEQPRVFSACWQSTVFLVGFYTAIASLRHTGWTWTDMGGSLVWSLVYHLGIFAVLYVILNWIWAAALFLPRALNAQFVMIHVFGAGMIWLVLRTVVFPTISLEGARAETYAAVLAVAVSTFVAGIRRRVLCLLRSTSRTEGPRNIAVVTLLGGWLALRAARMDWNYLLQELTAAAVWIAVFLIFYRMPLLVSIRPRSTQAMLLIAASIVIGFRLVQASPVSDNIQLDRYAGYDASFRLARELLTPRAGANEEDFYQFLSQNTNIARSARVSPVSIDLVEKLKPTPSLKPNIFIFVIDSLRRDYLSPYNPAVKFTPSVEGFARESVTFKNAFTRYGGTGLSQPSLWVGAMMLHMQYITPFAPMNSLQKLLNVDGYQPFASRDTILNTILGPWPTLTELDRSRPNMDYDCCTTLQELELQLGRAAGRSPLFAYTQPQNIHISVIQRQKESVLPGGPYEGFYAPYASRLARIDTCFGAFIRYLKARGIFENSVIVLTSDHGDSLGEEGRWGHAYSIFPEILRIPLIVHVPTALQERLVYDPEAVAFVTDITPSLYYMLGHRPIEKHESFGRPLFTETAEELRSYQRADYMVASSYAAVYGILSANGHRLYIADAANHRDYAFDLSGATSAVSLTDSMRSTSRQRVRDHIREINRLYGYTGPSSGELPSHSQ